MKWICKIFGHRWDSHGDLCGKWTCRRCPVVKPAIKWPPPPISVRIQVDASDALSGLRRAVALCCDACGEPYLYFGA